MATSTVKRKIELTSEEFRSLLVEYISKTNFQATVRLGDSSSRSLLGISLIRFDLDDIVKFFNEKGVTTTRKEIDENLRILMKEIEDLNKSRIHASVWEYVVDEPHLLEYNVSLYYPVPKLSYDQKYNRDRKLKDEL